MHYFYKKQSSVQSRFCHNTAQKMKFSIKYFFSKCDQIRRKLRICSHLLKSLMENFIFCAALSYIHDTHDMKNTSYMKTCEKLQAT